MGKPIMAKATAVWLVDNTTLSFKQIADFCEFHELEVQGIADGDVATGVNTIRHTVTRHYMVPALPSARRRSLYLHWMAPATACPTRSLVGIPGAATNCYPDNRAITLSENSIRW